MRICDLQTGRIQISRAAKRLREQWAITEEHWRDGNSDAFRQTHLQPLSPQVTQLLAAVHHLADVLEKAERECVDEDETLEL
jgi:hypothetical protein